MMKFVMTLKSMMLAVACCLVMPFSLQAQDVIISGRLVDDQQQPVEYANVVLLSLPDSAFVAGAVSDEQGAFRLINPGSGKLLRISCIGFGEIYRTWSGENWAWYSWSRTASC